MKEQKREQEVDWLNAEGAVGERGASRGSPGL